LIRPLPEAPAPAGTAPAAHEPQTTVRERQAPPPAVTTGLNRPPRSTSLTNLVDRKTEGKPPPPPPPAQENRVENQPFNQEDLIRCWDAYAETIEKEIHLKNTMLSCKPVLLENAHFEVTVHNQLQKEELIGHSLQLLKIMREQLSNSKIQIHVRIDETHEKKRAYTALEKYELLRQINPLLSKLKDEFDLSLD
jgi:DNA polymerase-3 subunit gamma/tau